MWIRCFSIVLAATALIPWPASAADFQIKAKDIYFTPSTRVITVGDTVTWTNDGDESHTVSSFPGAPAAFDSSPNDDVCDDGNPLTPERCLDPGDNFEFTFTTAGIYDYRCKVHGDTNAKPVAKGDQSEPCGMCGRVDVRAASSKPPEPSETPTLNRPSSPTPSPSVSPSPTVSPEESPSLPIEPGNGETPGGDSGGGAGSRGVIAIVAIAVLSGAGFFTWRRFLATG